MRVAKLGNGAHGDVSGRGEEPGEARPGGVPAPGSDLVGVLTSLLASSSSTSAKTRAIELLNRQDLARLSRLSARELASEGLTPIQSRRLEAAFELGRLVERARLSARPVLRCPERVHRFMVPTLRGARQESFHALLLDSKHRLIRDVRVSLGTLTSSPVHPREVFGPALRSAAAFVIACHNHPSGDPEPSAEDLEVTRRLADAGRLVGVPLLDHLVVTDQHFVSLKARMSF